MTKMLQEAPITTKGARARLQPGIWWRRLDTDVHLGYRKGKRVGTWFVRYRNGAGYKQLGIGPTDDFTDVGTLDFSAAVAEARAAVERARREAAAAAAGAPRTVADAVRAYCVVRDARVAAQRGRDSIRSDATSRLSKYVIGVEKRGRRKAIPAHALADIALTDLTPSLLREWVEGLPSDQLISSKRRTVSDLKAALNAVIDRHFEALPKGLAEDVRRGLRLTVPVGVTTAGVRPNQILSASQLARVIDAAAAVDSEFGWDGDLFDLITMLAATGARFSQIIRLRVCDLQPGLGRVMMPVSRKGKGTKAVDCVPVYLHRDEIEQLVRRTWNRPAEAPLFERWYMRQVGVSEWVPDHRGPWRTASQLARPWAAIRDAAGLEPGIVLYSFRHSKIVADLAKGLPVQHVAATHDTSSRMIERHYARYIADGLGALAAQHVTPLRPNRAGGQVLKMARA